MDKTLLLSQKEIEQLISMEDVLDAVEKTFEDFGKGTTINPTKLGLDLGESAEYPPYKGFMNAMPAYIGWRDVAGIKWAGGFLGKRKEMGLPYITSLILLIDPQVGNFIGVMDGATITNWRTGAQTAIALKHMIPKKNIKIGLYGAGMQGHTQTMAIAGKFDIEELRVYDIKSASREIFASDMANTVKGKIVTVDSPEKVCTPDIDAVICVTQSKDKFVKDSWISPGTILLPMGSYQECENDYILNADKIVVDHIGQCLHRGALKELNAEGKILEENIYCTIGDIVAGNKPAPDTSKERVLCIPIGTGAMDVAIADIALERAKMKNMGSEFTFV